jgi:hypothetical protein
MTYTPSGSYGSDGWNLVGNPYPSAINFNSVSRIGTVGNNYYLWDPILAGATGVGAFVTFSRNAGNTAYDRTSTSAGSTTLPTDGTIESGAAFLVDFGLSPGSLDIAETAKVTTSASTPFGRPTGSSANTQTSLRTNLLALNPDSTSFILDGVLSTFSSNYSNAITKEDALKISNFSENLGIRRNNQLIAIERSAPLTSNDTIFLNLTSLKVKGYQFELDSKGISEYNLAGYLQDTYLQTSLPLNMEGISKHSFVVNNVPASNAPNRFRIVFKKVITCNAISAVMLNNDIAVQWQVTGEENIYQYEVERSLDGVSFTNIATVKALGNNLPISNYSRLDEKPLPGIYYYRIKAMSNYGAIGYSETVQVKMMNSKGAMYVFPNPAGNGTIGLQLNAQAAGAYTLRLLNSAGQTIVAKTITHVGGTASVNIQYPAQLTGHYQLEITAANKKKTVLKVVIL